MMTKENEVSAPAGEADGGGLHGSEPVSRKEIEHAFEVLRIVSEEMDEAHRPRVVMVRPAKLLTWLAHINTARTDLAAALAETAKVQGGGLDSGWRTMESAPRDGTVVDLWMGADEFPHRVTDAKWCKPEHTCAGPNCDMCPGDVDEYAWREALTGYEYAIGTLAGPTHWRPPLPPSAPNLATQGNTEADTPSAQDAEDLAAAEASYAEYQENGGVTLDELKAELDAADPRDALIEELRGALGNYDRDRNRCPVRNRHYNKCPECGATEKETCGLDNPHTAIEAIRAALSRTGREG